MTEDFIFEVDRVSTDMVKQYERGRERYKGSAQEIVGISFVPMVMPKHSYYDHEDLFRAAVTKKYNEYIFMHYY